MGWFQDSAGITPVIAPWRFNVNTNGVTGLGFDSFYPRANLSSWGDGRLTTSSVDASGLTSVYLSYSEYQYGAPNRIDTANFVNTEVSNDGGVVWHNVFSLLNYQQIGNLIGYRKVIDISQYAANQQNVKIRFRKSYSFSWAIDSIVVSDVADCSSPADNKGITVNDREYLCSGSITNMQILNLSRGIGQTYQWQVQNPANGNVFTNIPGAVYDTLHYAQNGLSFYRCELTCNGSTATTKELQMPDYPADQTTVYPPADRGICTAIDDTIYLQSTNHHLGVGFQWMDNDSAFTVYNDIAGATDSFYVVKGSNYSADTYFKCKEECISSGLFRESDYWLEYINANPYCYCEPSNLNDCLPLNFPTSLYTGGMINVSIGSTPFNNTSGPCNNQMGPYNNYSFFDPAIPTNTATLVRGNTYNLSVTQDTVGRHEVGIWIDYDRNSFFDSTEFTFVVPFIPPLPGSTYIAPFTIPLSATPGLTGMRVRCSGNLINLTAERACAFVFGGETEDYMITIDTATAITDLTGQNGLQLQVYPNPISGKQQLTVAVSSSNNRVNTVKILTVQGSTVLTENFKGNTFATQAAFAPGIYAVQVNTGSEVLQRRLVVVK